MGLVENVRTETVERLSLREPVVAKPAERVRDVIQRIRDQHLGCAVIVSHKKPIGMFTESMLKEALLHRGGEFLDEPIRDHMAERWPWVRISDPISEVLEALQTRNIRFLCVVDDSDHLVGLTGQKGLMEYIADHYPQQVMVQRVGLESVIHRREGA